MMGSGSSFTDEIDCSSFFDHIDDLIDFPSDNDICFNSGGCNDFPSIWTNNSEELPGPDPMFSSAMKSNGASELSAELAVPYEDIVQLEWLSNFVEDSFSGGGLTINKENVPVNNDASNNQFRTSSPISVLESSSSSSCSEGKITPLSPAAHRSPQRARSKRPRPANFNPRSAMQFISQSSSVTDNAQYVNVPVLLSECENFAESHLIKIPKPASEEKKKKKKLKLSLPKDPAEMNCNPLPQASVRKCLHCEITKTPQWRAGPLGPKTLCNACGVRYKSGRLFPEYRPAASPTFVPSLHSNSHKKVVEMRIKGGEKKIANATVPPLATEPEMIPNASLEYM